MGQAHPIYSPAELWADGVVHVLGVLFALGALIFLFGHGVSLALYGLGLVGMLGASAAYNLWQGRAKELLRRLDHAMIFVMIAGSYTPFVVLRLTGGTAALVGAVVWTGALAGVILKLLYPRRFEKFLLALYLILGWALVLGFHPLISSLGTSTMVLLLVGGAIYTLGVPLHLAKLRFQNAAWHACVLAAAICHFAAISVEFA